MSDPPVRRAPRTEAPKYLKKAQDFGRMMDLAEHRDNSNAAALAAVHCVISASDAVTVHLRGERSVGRDHRDVLQLLAHAELEDPRTLLNQVRQVLDKKSAVEYEGRSVTPSEARELCATARRVLLRAITILGDAA